MPAQRLQRRLFAPLLALPAVFVLAVGFTGYETLVRSEMLQARVAEVQRANELALQLIVLQGAAQAQLLRYVAHPDDALAGDIERLQTDMTRAAIELGGLQGTQPARQLFLQYRAAQARRAETREQLMRAAAAGDLRAIEVSSRRWNAARRGSEALLEDVSAYQLNVLERTVDDLEHRRAVSMLLLGAALLLAVTVVLGYAWHVGRTVVAPIESLTDAAAGLPAAPFEPPPQSLERGDEIGVLARTLARVTGEMRAANERLRESDRRKDEFLGMLSHELRNPLAPIRNALFILDHDSATPAQKQRAQEVARRQVSHLSHLVDDLLDVTRIARGRIDLRRAELDLCALVRRTADDHHGLFAERGLELAVETDGVVAVDGDQTRLVQIVGNLLHNAAKFSPRGGRVTLSVAAEAGEALVRVCDNGAGIAPELLERIFEPFMQAEQTLARSEGGLGLGLALVKMLVELHGGTVSAASEGTGCGSLFTVRLPLLSRPSAAGAGDGRSTGAGASG